MERFQQLKDTVGKLTLSELIRVGTIRYPMLELHASADFNSVIDRIAEELSQENVRIGETSVNGINFILDPVVPSDELWVLTDGAVSHKFKIQ